MHFLKALWDDNIWRSKLIPKSESISSEDNFGYYNVMNPKFRAEPQAPTQWWFGGYLWYREIPLLISKGMAER